MKSNPLPSGVLPRGLSRLQAAAYIGVSVAKFDEMIGDKRMPKPKRIDRRLVWDRAEIDDFFGALPSDGEDDAGGNPWDAAA